LLLCQQLNIHNLLFNQHKNFTCYINNCSEQEEKTETSEIELDLYIAIHPSFKYYGTCLSLEASASNLDSYYLIKQFFLEVQVPPPKA
jgi:hypothetical protein